MICSAMLQKTKVISLSYIRYKETSIIARFFTEQFGLQSFVVNGVRSPKSKMPAGLFQPLQLLEIVQYFNEKKDLHRLVEIKPAVPLVDLPFNHIKSSMSIFIAELVSKIIREGQSNGPLFELIWNWVINIDKQKTGFESAHIQLVYQMLQPLGITPENWLDFFEKLSYQKWFTLEDGNLFFESLALENENFHPIGNTAKQAVLDVLIAYFQKHMDGLGQLNSLTILRDVFR
jgi:DNA repair protein RecO (recombination protein O)